MPPGAPPLRTKAHGPGIVWHEGFVHVQMLFAPHEGFATHEAGFAYHEVRSEQPLT